ncbi:hypothetical protein [Polycladospora coralii]|nr:hypothetical protein [Polycladospora coralii]
MLGLQPIVIMIQSQRKIETILEQVKVLRIYTENEQTLEES